MLIVVGYIWKKNLVLKKNTLHQNYNVEESVTGGKKKKK